MLSDGTQSQTTVANDTIDPQAVPSGVGFGGGGVGVAGVTTSNNETSNSGSVPAPPGVNISHVETE